MELINTIINELVDTNKSITSPFLKAKVLASQIQNSELLNWADSELQGYKSNNVPDYRTIFGHLQGNCINGYYRLTNYNLPTDNLDEETENKLKTIYLTQGINAIENLLRNEKGNVSFSLPSTIRSFLESNIQEMGNPYFQITSVFINIDKSILDWVLGIIRNKLLDFMLRIMDEFGQAVEIKDLKENKEKVNTIMNQTIINNSGDGVVLNTGNDANINASIQINKGSKDELIQKLKEANVPESDIQELVEIIDNDEPNIETQTLGTGAKTWVQKMFAKALDGSWSVGMSVAGGVLVELIKKYYGW